MLKQHEENVQKWRKDMEEQEKQDRQRRQLRHQELMASKKANEALLPWPKVRAF